MAARPHSADPWALLRKFTQARIGLGNVGDSLPTRPWLEFQLAHAQARDAVHLAFEAEDLAGQIRKRGWQAIVVSSGARDRTEYLKRPDLGRRLQKGAQRSLPDTGTRHDIAVIIADGLSAMAVHRHALPLLEVVLPGLTEQGLSIAPLVLVQQGRVAIGDEIAALLSAQIAILLIGERPGLSSPDSLGVYMTYNPKPGCTDADRNCISNIRPQGLGYELAGRKLLYLVAESAHRKLSGVQLKDQFELLGSTGSRGDQTLRGETHGAR